jgi:hypothetical protein
VAGRLLSVTSVEFSDGGVTIDVGDEDGDVNFSALLAAARMFLEALPFEARETVLRWEANVTSPPPGAHYPDPVTGKDY